MCEECLRRYGDMDKRVIDIMDEATSDFITLANKMGEMMDQRVGKQSVEVQRPDGTTCLLEELPLEEQPNVLRQVTLARQVTMLAALTGYMSFRYCDGVGEAVALMQTTESAMVSGREMGQVTKVFVKGGSHN